MNKINTAIFFHIAFFIIFIIISACEKVLDIELPDSEKKIVVNSITKVNEPFKINISKSIHIFEDEDFDPYLINNVDIKLYENDNQIALLKNEKEKYFYTLEKCKSNANYRIEASYGNLKSVEAEMTIPQKIEIISIDTQSVKVVDFGYIQNLLRCEIKFSDNLDIENYYMFSIFYKYKEYIYDDLGEKIDSIEYLYDISESNEEFLAETSTQIYLNGLAYFYFTDEIFNGQEYIFSVNIDPYYINFFDENGNQIEDTYIYLELVHLPEDLFLFYKSYNAYLDSHNNPLAEPVNIYSNINNGIGIFSGKNIYRDSIKIKRPKY